MKSAIAGHLTCDNYVVRIDGRVKSHHRRFIDALREGLYLRDQFPQHDVKVGAMHQSGQQKLCTRSFLKAGKFAYLAD